MNPKNNFKEATTVIFLHIPKTGGLSLSKIASENYDSDSIYTLDGRQIKQSINELKELSIEEKRKIKFLTGHTAFGIHEYLPNESTYVTILREPVERVISSYYYMLTTPNHPFHKDVAKNNMSFEEFLESEANKRFIFHDNCQVRLLSGIKGVEYGKCSRAMLETAKSNLNYFFSVVGVVEKFDEFLIICQRKLGWKFLFYQKINVNKKRLSKEEISEKALRKIEADNALDIELYNYVKEEVKKSLRQDNLQLNSTFFKFANRIYEHALDIQLIKKYPRRVSRKISKFIQFIKS